MEKKKSPRANLNRYSSLFLWLGLVFVLFVSWRAVEFRQKSNELAANDTWAFRADDPEQTRIIKVVRPRASRQPKKVLPVVVRKVPNDSTVENVQFLPLDPDDDPSVDNPIDIPTVDPIEDNPVPFQKVESVPVFPGCEKYKNDKEKLIRCISRKLNRFINRKFNKDIASDLGIEGVVKIYAGFVVDKDGQIVDIRVRSPYKQLVQETKRVLSSMPRWKPGEQRGKKVKVEYFLPIRFRVSE